MVRPAGATCFNCAMLISDHWAGDFHVVECRDKAKEEKRSFLPFDKTVCPRWEPRING